ncbi:cyclin-dependent protein kinase regulator Pho80 [Coprinopsis cinerea okayama7|uniref:Cyclin-dependent protein kinase regulator Pho80 n=1 Tax=Coprinopsis cinerea (strain Okayama-7 / 130 / ATCC MYA-4618 / FGSC 9003) TaxID=240176 RepID=A8N6J2_COPC7|nr:cyclin-dependent protein kinase regulator Pho80 [Coprinopsis cinerea okayama7\|eukprot:XP_001830448.2 cyclin-dependent protein kinase regulator Pho80 [Coprinopsis cinerea okayama7\
MASSNAGRVELPANFEDVPIDYVLQLIADMLERLMAHNDQIPLSPESLTRFHSRTPPGISIIDYLKRIVRFTNVEKSCLFLILVYIDQICARWPVFTFSSLTAHRFIIAAITVSSKGLCDTFSPNKFYARCTREILQEYYVNLARTHSGGNFVIAGSNSPLSSDSDIDMDSSGQSAPPSPSDRTTTGRRHRSQRSISEPSTVLVEPGTSVQGVVQRPTLEQEMAFAALRNTQERR